MALESMSWFILHGIIICLALITKDNRLFNGINKPSPFSLIVKLFPMTQIVDDYILYFVKLETYRPFYFISFLFCCSRNYFITVTLNCNVELQKCRTMEMSNNIQVCTKLKQQKY